MQQQQEKDDDDGVGDGANKGVAAGRNGDEEEELLEVGGGGAAATAAAASASATVDLHQRQPTIRIRSESVRRVVDDKPNLTLSWENVTIRVGDGSGEQKDRYCCGCCCASCGGSGGGSSGGGGCCAPFQRYAKEYLGTTVREGGSFYAVHDVSGFVRTGETILVLGPNYESSSAMLRALSGRLSKRDADLIGAVSLDGMPLSRSGRVGQGWRRFVPHVGASDATHAAVLTVRETLEFAARCCWSSSSSAAGGDVGDRVDALLEALDLVDVADTVVGDENLRGISGGQKRRVTVGEMLVSDRCGFLALEHITDGLSSQDSNHLVRRIQEVCRVFKIGAIVSLLQPSDEIVEYFDKLMVLSSDGELNYFGPVDRNVLDGLFGGSSGGSSAGSICDLVLRNQAGDGVNGDDNASDEAAAKAAGSTNHTKRRYHESEEYAEMVKTLTAIRTESLPAHRQDVSALLPPDKYAASYPEQFRIVGARRIKLIARNAVTYTRVGIAIVFGAIVGSLFGNLDQDIVGSLSRTGYMFLNCFLVLMLSAAITIPQTFRERVTLFKHRSAEFYSGRVAYVTQMLLDIPLSVLEAVLLSVIGYFWVGMNPGVPNFFYFMGVLIGLEFVGQSLGRLLCAVSRKQILANIFSSALILIFGTVAGFMPSYSTIPAIFRWLSWLTPAAYAFEGLMVNQFDGTNLTGFTVTTNEGTVDLLSFSGNGWLNATGLPREQWATNTGMKLFDLAMLFILSIILDLLGCYWVEHTREWYFNLSRRPQRTAASTSFDVSGSAAKEKDDPSDGTEKMADWPNSLSVRNVCYFVPLKSKRAPLRFTWRSILDPCLVACFGKERGKGIDEEEIMEEEQVQEHKELQLLSSVNARFGRGRMTALMGTSGAGKTTLLDVVAGFKTGGRITGEMLIDGHPKEKDVWKSISAYAEQMDILNPYLSTLETLRFTAACRLPNDVDREGVINNIVSLMELKEYEDYVIGREQDDEGLPKHARKRLTIAIQLVTLPKILFCDEPTTGLGTTSASIVMQALRRCTDKLKLITVVTIHQPSKLIWDAFDDLLLLVKGGKTAYMGPMGVNSQQVIEYFSKLSGESPPDKTNPADYVLSCVTNLTASEVYDSFQKSEISKATVECIESEMTSESAKSNSATAMKNARKQSQRSKNFFKELILLTKRHFMTQWRNPSYSMMRLFTSCFVSLYMSILFDGDKSSVDGAVFSIGAIFFMVFVLVIPMQASVVHLIEDRAVLYREVSSGLYSRLAYGFGQLLADIPFHILNALVMFVMFYFIVGFQREGPLIGYFILMTFAANWVIMSLGQFFALAMPNEESATGLSGLAVILSVILMGFLITINAMPQGWRWAYHANLIHYIVQGYTTNELVGRNYRVLLPGDLLPENATSAIFFPTDADSSMAEAASGFLSLAIAAGPGTNYDWEKSGIVAVATLVDCMSANKCLEEPLAENFISCCIFNPFEEPPCKNELDQALANVNLTGVVDCVAPYAVESAVSGVVSSFTDNSLGLPNPLGALRDEELQDMDSEAKLDLVLCLLRVLLPPGFFDSLVQSMEDILDIVFAAVPVVIEIVENGLSIPGELILWVFGWAEWQPEQGLVAPFKWWYCMFAVAMFLVGIEVLKILALQFVVWTKR